MTTWAPSACFHFHPASSAAKAFSDPVLDANVGSWAAASAETLESEVSLSGHSQSTQEEV